MKHFVVRTVGLCLVVVFGSAFSALNGQTCTPPPSGIAAWWPLDEMTGTTSREIVGLNHGTWMGNPIPVPLMCGPSALRMLTSNDFVSVSTGSSPKLNFGKGSFSIDAWIRTSDTTAADRAIVDKRVGTISNPQGYSLALHFDGHLVCQVDDGGTFGGNYEASDPILWDGVKHHVACVVDRSVTPGVVTLYVDGVARTLSATHTLATGSVSNNAPLLIGHQNTGFEVANAFAGDIDEVELFNRALTVQEVLGIYRACKCPCASPPPGMTAWWPLNEDNIQGQAKEIVAANNGAYAGAPVPVLGEKVINSHKFTTASDYVTASSPKLNFGLGSFSIDAWILTSDTTAADRAIVDKRVGNFSNPQGYTLALHFDGHLVAQVDDGGTFGGNYLEDGTVILWDGKWHHVAFTVDRSVTPGVVALYVDGIARHLSFTHTPATGSVSNSAPLLIGHQNAGFEVTNAFDGDIDEVELFDRVLAPQEVLGIYNAGGAGKCPCVSPPTEMCAWWPLDENTIIGGQAKEIVAGNNGAYVSNPVPVPGEVSGALKVPTASDFVSVSNSPKLNFATRSFSIDAWIQTSDTTAADRAIVDKRSGTVSNPKGYSLAIHSDGKLVCQVGDGSAFAGNHLACDPILWDGLWHHVACIVDRSGATGVVTLYVDGTKRALCTSSVVAMGDVSNEAPLRIGQQDPGFDQTHTLNGCIDEVELFDRALTPLEVLTLYSADRGGKWKFQAFTGVPLPIPALGRLGVTMLTVVMILVGAALLYRRYAATLRGV